MAPADNYFPRESKEQAVFDCADNVIEVMRRLLWTGHRSKGAVSDIVATVGNQRRSVGA